MRLRADTSGVSGQQRAEPAVGGTSICTISSAPVLPWTCNAERQRSFSALEAQVENMLADPTLAGLHPFLTELRQQTGTWKEELLRTAARVGDATFRPALREAVALWTECANLYGTGFPYRYGVADRLGAWFGQDEQRHLFQSRPQEAWNASWMQKLDPIVTALAVEAQTERTGTEG